MQAKLQRFRDYRVLCCSLRRHLRKLLAVVQIEKTHFFAFTILRCYKIRKKAFTLADRAFEIKQFYKHAGVPIFVEHWRGDNLQFYPNFDLFSTLGGMNLDHDFIRVSKLSEEQNKKKVFIKNGTLFSLKSTEDLRSDAHQSEIIEGYADEDHTQIIGGDTVKLLGGYIPPIARVLAPLPALVSPFAFLIGHFALRNFETSEKDNLFF